MSFDDDIRAAWRDHGDHPREVADRLASLRDRIEQPDQIAPFARLAAHVLGEHLGAWDEALALYARVPAEDQRWCAAELAGLSG